MTLYKQLMALIVMLFAVFLAGTLVIDLQNTRAFLERQLESHAQDGATSLGLMLSSHLQQGDQASMTAVVDSIFDRGYYQQISVVATDGKVLIERQSALQIDAVPQWLVERLPLQVPSASALLMNGWKQAGEVRVRSHPGYAYAQLWSTASMMLSWFSLLIVAGLGAALYGMRILLRPLAAVERQAEAIGECRYEVQPRLPRTRELRRVVSAMNEMAEKVRRTFESQAAAAQQLRTLAYADALTGVGNRRFFEAQLQEQLAGDSAHGVLLLLRLDGLQRLNDERGREAGDAFVNAAAERISTVLANHQPSVLTRIGGAEFALLLEGADQAQADVIARAILAELAALHRLGLAPEVNIAHIGGAEFHPACDKTCLLANADSALRAAQQHGPNRWQIYRSEAAATSRHQGREEWIRRLRAALESRQLLLHAQPARVFADAARIMHYELLVRLPAPAGESFAADKFMPLAEELDLAKEIDRLVLSGAAATGPTDVALAVNLSLATLTDAQSWAQLFAACGTARHTLVFEVPETCAVWHLERLREFAQQAKRHGHDIALDQFGRGFGSFGYLQSLRPSYVKADGMFSRDIHSDRDKQFYVQSLCNVCHSLDIPLLATQVERQEDWSLLQSLGVDGVQGYSAGGIAALTQWLADE